MKKLTPTQVKDKRKALKKYILNAEKKYNKRIILLKKRCPHSYSGTDYICRYCGKR